MGVRGHILIVEDDPLIGESLLELLEMAGYTGQWACSGLEAWSMLHEKDFDTIVSDLQMPGMSGEELWRRIRSWHAELAEKMLFITAAEAEHPIRQFLSESGRPCLTKPFKLKEFLGLVQAMASSPRGEENSSAA